MSCDVIVFVKSDTQEPKTLSMGLSTLKKFGHAFCFERRTCRGLPSPAPPPSPEREWSRKCRLAILELTLFEKVLVNM